VTKKILLIEDETDFANLVSSFLSQKGYLVIPVISAKKALQALSKNTFSSIILDLGLPDRDGLILCKQIRKLYQTPILILTARDDTIDKVKGFRLGADDYMVKPASLKELSLRIKRLGKRKLNPNLRSSVFKFCGLNFDTSTGKISSPQKKTIKLSKKEKELLTFLIIKKNKVLSRLEIMDHVWGDDIDSFSNIVDILVHSIRKKLKKLTKKQIIVSVHGLGYKLSCP